MIRGSDIARFSVLRMEMTTPNIELRNNFEAGERAR
jgi:hypothetical protein